MNNLIFGISTFLFCICGYYCSYRAFRIANYQSAIFWIFLCGLILRVYTGTDLYLHNWDERYHALVAKNLLNHPLKPTLYDNPLFHYDIQNWVANHVWLEKPPLSLWFASLSLKIFGLSEIALRLPSILISAFAILFTFLIGKELFNRKIGLLAAFLHSIHGLLIEVAAGRVSSDLVETCFVFFVEVALCVGIYSIKRKPSYTFSIFIGILMGCSLLSKWNPGLLVIPVWFIGAFFSKKYSLKQLILHSFVILLSGGVTFLPWIFHVMRNFPAEGEFVLKKFVNAYNNTLENHKGPIYYYLVQIRILFGEVIYIPLVISAFFICRKKVRWELILITAWWLIPMIVFSLAATKRQTYLLICSPAFFLVISYIFFYLKYIRFKFKYKIFINVILVLLIVLPIRYSIERIKPFEITSGESKIASKQKNIKHLLPQRRNIVLFNINSPIEVMFYTDCIAYQNIPEEQKINELINSGYLIVINDDGVIDLSSFKKNSAIIIRKLL
ncbi:MAG: glycosyltransferase family 39 protein [Bacteroidetes bacterium]|nr:glycosyltransferase family 39 protein [Bacteroidota bacterium]